MLRLSQSVFTHLRSGGKRFIAAFGMKSHQSNSIRKDFKLPHYRQYPTATRTYSPRDHISEREMLQLKHRHTPKSADDWNAHVAAMLRLREPTDRIVQYVEQFDVSTLIPAHISDFSALLRYPELTIVHIVSTSVQASREV